MSTKEKNKYIQKQRNLKYHNNKNCNLLLFEHGTIKQKTKLVNFFLLVNAYLIIN